MVMSKTEVYLRPEILTLDSEELIGHLGPAQGYAADARSETAFDSLSPTPRGGGLRRK
jgi:hypothetical protein